MATGKITKRSIDSAGVGFFWDTDLRGFGLRVRAGGSRTYIYQYRMGGRESPALRHTIGPHGSPWTPATARQEAERLALLVGQGVDPREQEQTRRREAVDLAFRAYAVRFLDRYVRTEWSASFGYAESILRLHVTPVLGNKPLPAITRADVTTVLDRLPVASFALRRNVYSVVRRLFRWAVSRGDIERSPLEGFDSPAPASSRDRVLTDAELSLAWRAAEALGYPFGPFFRLLILTGQRREEVAALDWNELDRATRTWTLSGDRTKNSRAHIVPLSARALEILDQLARPGTWPEKGHVFSTTGVTSVSGYSRAKRRLDDAMATLAAQSAEVDAPSVIPPWRVHDLRRTMATGLQRLGVRFEVTEAVLNHVSGARGGVAGIYQRHDWASEKRDALERWGDFVRALGDGEPVPGKLVRLHGAR